MFSLNALDPKLVWHIEKETKEGLGSWEKRGGGPNGQRETEGERRGTFHGKVGMVTVRATLS